MNAHCLQVKGLPAANKLEILREFGSNLLGMRRCRKLGILLGVPIVAQRKRTLPGSMRMRVQSLASLSRLGIQCGHELWRWCRLAAATPIRPLAWELPYAAGAALKRKKKFSWKYLTCVKACTVVFLQHTECLLPERHPELLSGGAGGQPLTLAGLPRGETFFILAPPPPTALGQGILKSPPSSL